MAASATERAASSSKLAPTISPGSKSYRQSISYPDTPAICIGVNQSSRSPLKGRPTPPAQPQGGLFAFYLPPPVRIPTARELFEKDAPTTKERLQAIKPVEALAPPLDEGSYMTPRMRFREKSKGTEAVVAGGIAKGTKAGTRVKGLTKFFDQFNDVLSA